MPTESGKAARDYGAVRRYGMATVIVSVMAVSGAAAFFAYDILRARHADIATAAAWDIKGAACAQLTLAQWNAKHLKVREATNYDGRMIGRWSGDVSCSDVKDHGGAGFGTDRICQFTNP